MIVCRTPFRISFFGGGTDYPAWYLRNGGSVLSTSINKYCYISIRYLPPFFEHRIRLVYSKVELCQQYDEIKHPAVRETLRFMKVDQGLEIHHDGDLPARSGMGSSSSFTVGLLNALYALRGKRVTKKQLADESIEIEQELIKETVGSQDQVAAAFGGLNQIIFKKNGEIEINPITISVTRSDELNSHLMLFYTGIMRTASDVADSYVPDILSKEKLLYKMHDMVEKSISILQGDSAMSDFGELLNETWQAKRQLSGKVTNPVVDGLYKRARENGAIGGKITGAGGGGFLLLFVPPPLQDKVRKALCELLHVPFRFDFSGSRIIVYEPHLDDYGNIERVGDNNCIQAFRELHTI
jgi:D-glycero-alpha-D-manno-heptose-7-phosphate kinase